MLNKLKTYGISNEELGCFASHLLYRKILCIYSGVLQRSILGPLLFLIFFNDFPDALKESKVLIYADDTVIYCAYSDNNVVAKVLNEEMSYLWHYLYQNELTLNLKKAKWETMVLGTAKRLSMTLKCISIKYNSNVINNSTAYKCLGNQLDRNLNLD